MNRILGNKNCQPLHEHSQKPKNGPYVILIDAIFDLNLIPQKYDNEFVSKVVPYQSPLEQN